MADPDTDNDFDEDARANPIEIDVDARSEADGDREAEQAEGDEHDEQDEQEDEPDGESSRAHKVLFLLVVCAHVCMYMCACFVRKCALCACPRRTVRAPVRLALMRCHITVCCEI